MTGADSATIAATIASVTVEVERRQPPGKEPRRNGAEITFLCPTHDDHRPSA